MGLPVKAFPFTVVSHVLAIVALILVLVWAVHFRGGLAWEAVNKNLIFNVSLETKYFVIFFIISNFSNFALFSFYFLFFFSRIYQIKDKEVGKV